MDIAGRYKAPLFRVDVLQLRLRSGRWCYGRGAAAA